MGESHGWRRRPGRVIRHVRAHATADEEPHARRGAASHGCTRAALTAEAGTRDDTPFSVQLRASTEYRLGALLCSLL